MPKRPQFRLRRVENGWIISVPATCSASGRREQLHFKSRDTARDAATKFRERLAQHGEAASIIRPSLAEDATAAALILEPYGMTLLEAARIVAAAKERDGASRPITDALKAWLEDCEALRAKTQSGYRQTASRLQGALGSKLMSTITADQLKAAIAPAGTPPTSALCHLRTARAFWRWSAQKRWCDANVIDGVQLQKTGRANSAEISVLSPAEAETLLRTAEKHFPQSVASYAIQLFAGVRAEELVRLKADHVSVEGVELPAGVTKKGRRRYISASATLSAWLEAHPFQPCPNWRRVDRAVRHLAGWDLAPEPLLVPQDMIDKRKRRPWPQNVLRHSHASYAVAAGEALERLLFEFGHSASTTVLREHYLGRSSKRDALKFFALRPGGENAKVAPKLAIA